MWVKASDIWWCQRFTCSDRVTDLESRLGVDAVALVTGRPGSSAGVGPERRHVAVVFLAEM